MVLDWRFDAQATPLTTASVRRGPVGRDHQPPRIRDSWHRSDHGTALGARRQIALREVCQQTLACDHRICHGGTARGFLRFIVDCTESPFVTCRLSVS